ncbi:MAG: hypothetical protein PVS3B1_05510 [Ktedonobacteraceae bacterium]
MPTVLQRVERHEKTGLLVLKNSDFQSIEFYLHEGRLLCIGPMRTNASLGERLLRDGVISPVVLRETLLVLGNTDASESLLARTLMELNYVSREEMRAWAIERAVDVLNVVLAWPSGEMYFEEETLPPTDRLLVSISISSLLARVSSVSRTVTQGTGYRSNSAELPSTPSTPQSVTTPLISERNRQAPVAPVAPATPTPDVARMTTLTGATQLIGDSAFSDSSPLSPFPSPVASLPTTEPFAPVMANDQSAAPVSLFADLQGDVGAFPSFLVDVSDIEVAPAPPPLQPVPVMQPVPPRHIDIGFMQPDMVLVPADLSGLREQNPQVQLTPDQWRLLTFIDGQNTLQMMCQFLAAPADVVCTVAGELIAEGLIHVAVPGAVQGQKLSLLPPDVISPGYVAPGYASAAASPWSVSIPAVPAPTDYPPQAFPPVPPVPTESQWGNGENGATFVPGRGWIMNTPPHTHPLQPLQGDNMQGMPGGVYAPAGMGY